MQNITPCLWFDTEAEQAAQFYVSIFKDSKIGRVSRYGEEGREITGKEPGSVMTVMFRINGQEFMALNGGPQFSFTEAVSFCINCDDQEEVDAYTEKLISDGGEQGPCGWVKDKFGLSWQITPVILDELMSDPDPVKSQRVMKAMLQMKKLDIAALKRAYEGA